MGGEVADLIEGGAIRDGNLFHSFLEFNVEAGQRLYFANPTGIESILSRVTGGNPSNIFGTLGVDGAADLFLLNPNGIVFGENASLDVGGSFAATTADAIPLGDSGVFSATEPEQSSLLTVNPNALFTAYLTNTSGDIINQGLLFPGESLTLAANRLDLGGTIAAGGALTLLANSDIAITDALVVTFDSAEPARPEGDILIQGEAVSIEESTLIVSSQAPSSNTDDNLSPANPLPLGGDLQIQGNSILVVNSLLTTAGFRGQRGDIRLIAEESVDIFATEARSFGLNSAIVGNGMAGEITITAANLNIIDTDAEINFINGVSLLSTAFAGGNSGNIILDINETIRLDGIQISTGASDGTAGDIQISTADLILQNGASLNSGTNANNNELVSGNAGDITIEASGTVRLEGFGRRLINPQLIDIGFSSIFATTLGEAGEAGNIQITANRLILDDQAAIGSNSSSIGQAGTILITARKLQLQNGSNISSGSSGGGFAGDITLEIDGAVLLTGVSTNGQNPSGVFSRTSNNSDGGSINLSANQLDLLDGATISTENFGSGNGGNITLKVEETIRIEGINPVTQNSGSSINSSTTQSASGDSGDIQIQASELILRNGAGIYSNTFGQGNAGQQVFEVDTIQIVGDFAGSPSGFFSDVNPFANGNGGNQVIRSDSLTILDGGTISASTFGNGDAGNLSINSGEITVSGVNSEGLPGGILTAVAEGGNGQGGFIDIQANRLVVEDGSVIGTGTLSNGDAGNLTVRARDIEVIGTGGADLRSGLSTVATSTSTGNGGNLQIDSENLFIRDGAFLAATTNGSGNAGGITVNSIRTILTGTDTETGLPSGILTRTRENAQGTGGNINVNTSELGLTDGAVINAQTFNAFPSGDITINTNTASFSTGGQVVTSTTSSGNAGNIILNVVETARFAGRDLTFDTRLQQVLNNEILVPEDFSNESPASGLFANTREGSTGTGGRITVNGPTITLDDGAQIFSQSLGTGVAGSVILNATNRLQLTNSDIVTVASQSSGGDIAINQAEGSNRGLVVLLSDSDITTESFGDGGNITMGGAAMIALDDSDIVARSQSARGGNITLTRLFSQTFPPDSQPPFDGDGQVDVNADGQIAAGVISIGDTTLLENSLAGLEESALDTDVLTANSCIARTDEEPQGSFVVTGRGGLAHRPGDTVISHYPTGTVRTLPPSSATRPLQEPDGVYQLADGRLVLSHECDS